MRLGLVVNPIAGMGGKVALKGSDDPEILAVARARGAEPAAPARAIEALKTVAAAADEGLELFAYPGEMGEQEARAAGLDAEVLGAIGPVTTKRTAPPPSPSAPHRPPPRPPPPRTPRPVPKRTRPRGPPAPHTKASR